MVILRTRNKITDFLMILAWASPFNKGDVTDPNKPNFRGISLLSCFSELFTPTSCLNERLSNFVKTHDTVGPEQAMCRPNTLVQES